MSGEKVYYAADQYGWTGEYKCTREEAEKEAKEHEKKTGRNSGVLKMSAHIARKKCE